ncbi:MAG: SsrA-binding protein SmpB [Spirochaetaceae bacterium]|nr:MAG: SsrA-binding protein SmpB [Spirochaetaceae bacterium]
MASPKDTGEKILAVNKKAHFNYEVTDTIECGIVLVGTEVKSMRDGKFTFTDAYAKVEQDELWLIGLHISPYTFGNLFNHDPLRKRKLLAHKQEIKRLRRKTDEKGLTLIPLKFYLKGGRVKAEIGICKGKRTFDKRHDIKERDVKRDIERQFRHRI